MLKKDRLRPKLVLKQQISPLKAVVLFIAIAAIVFSFGMLYLFEIHASSENRLFDFLIKGDQRLRGSASSPIPAAPVLGTTVKVAKAHREKYKVAFAITITKDGNFQDGAAVLAYSIYNAFRNDTDAEFSLVAFVHPNVTQARPPLTKLGYHVIEVPTPINVAAIQYKFLREHIDKNGCCGAAELIKLSSYRLVQYDKVVHLDADVTIVKSFLDVIRRDKSLMYTTDPNMASHKGPDKLPVQGGFLIIKPSMEDYNRIVDAIMTTEFFQGSAWGGSKIGWFWGGMTIQGILPYYYRRISNEKRTEILDRCYFNTMADVEQCQTQQVDEIFSAHFTVCQKPWSCYKAYANRLCGDLHHRWFKQRFETEKWYSIPGSQEACPRQGKRRYTPMLLDNVKLPSFFVPDQSPDLLSPTEAARF